MSLMYQEIWQQKDVASLILQNEEKNIIKAVHFLEKKKINLIIIAARGTSDNAAILAKYLFECINGIPTSLASPSVFTLYKTKMDLRNSLVLGISQSGEATDVVEVIKKGKEYGALTIGITNQLKSNLSQSADWTLFCHAGEEKSVAATKTYIAEIMVLYLLSFLWKNDQKLWKALNKIPEEMEDVLKEKSEEIKNLAGYFRFMEECAVISRGFNYATAKEVALKLAETCYISSSGYSAADFLHGPIAVVEDGYPVIIYASRGATYSMIYQAAQKIKKKKGELLIISNSKEILELAKVGLYLNTKLDEVLTPLLYIIPGQLFANFLAQEKGYSPDKPRYLKKITRTK